VGLRLIGISGGQCRSLFVRTQELDAQLVRPCVNIWLHIRAPGPEHVVCSENELVVQVHGGIGIEPLEDQVQVRSMKQCSVGGDRCAVGPSRFFNPRVESRRQKMRRAFEDIQEGSS
jgi:hypothetical protein